MKLDDRFAEWSQGRLDDAELLNSIESARASVEEHRQGFACVLETLSETEEEHTTPLISYCEELMDRLPEFLEEARASVVSGTKSATLSIADQLSRSSFQLDNALNEFRNQVLLVRGPTRIPSLNLLYSLGDDWAKDPQREKFDRFMGAVAGELALARRSIQLLESELLETSTKDPLKRSFLELVEHLECLQRDLVGRGEAGFDLTGHLLQLNMTYTDIHDLSPKVALELQDRGETEFPEVNRLLTLLEAVASGEKGEELLLTALERFDGLIDDLDRQAAEAGGVAATDDQLERLSDALTAYGDGVALITSFQEERDPDLLRRARRSFVDFGAYLTGAQNGASVDLFDVGESAMQAQDSVPEKLMPVYQAVDDLLVERIDEQAFLRVVCYFENHLRGQLKKARAENVVAPLKSMLVGLHSLLRFPAHREENDLRHGVLALRDGARALRGALS